MDRNRFFGADEKIDNPEHQHHKIPAPILARCQNCDEKGVVIVEVKHENQHTDEKTVKCPVCNGSRFVS